MNWNRTLQRIAFDASQVSPMKVVVTAFTFPFYVLGLVIGWLWMLCTLAYAAVAVGVDAVRPMKDEDDNDGTG